MLLSVVSHRWEKLKQSHTSEQIMRMAFNCIESIWAIGMHFYRNFYFHTHTQSHKKVSMIQNTRRHRCFITTANEDIWLLKNWSGEKVLLLRGVTMYRDEYQLPDSHSAIENPVAMNECTLVYYLWKRL